MRAANPAGQYLGRRGELHVGTANSFINMPRKGGYTEQVARIGRKIEKKAPAGWG